MCEAACRFKGDAVSVKGVNVWQGQLVCGYPQLCSVQLLQCTVKKGKGAVAFLFVTDSSHCCAGHCQWHY